MKVGRECGHQTLDVILPHHNESVHGLKCSYFFVNLFLTWLQYGIMRPSKFDLEILHV